MNITVEIHFGKNCLRACCIFNCTTQNEKKSLSTLLYFLKNFSKSLYFNKRKKASICLNFTFLLNGFWYFEQLCFSNCWKKKSFICSYLTSQIHDLLHISQTYFFCKKKFFCSNYFLTVLICQFCLFYLWKKR